MTGRRSRGRRHDRRVGANGLGSLTEGFLVRSEAAQLWRQSKQVQVQVGRFFGGNRVLLLFSPMIH